MNREPSTVRHVLAILAIVVALGLGCSRPPAAPDVKVDSLDRATAQLIVEARRAIDGNVSAAAAWGRYGQVLHSADFFAEAAACYRRAAELEKGSVRWWHLLGLVELQQSDEIGLDHLSRAAELAGDNLDIPRLRLSQALLERGRLEEAGRHLDRLLAVKPQHPAALLESGRLSMVRGDATRAVERLQPCLTNAFTSRPALLLLAQAQQRLGQAELATRMSQRAAGMARPFDWPDPFLRDVQALRVGPKRIADQANSWMMQRRLPEAREAVDRLRSQFPSEPEGVLLAGRLQYLNKACAEAEETFRQYLALEPGSLNGQMQLSLALLCQQKWAEAAATLRQVASVKPDFAQAHSNLGLALLRVGDIPAATQSFEAALRCNPADVSALTWLAELALQKQDLPLARSYWERASQLSPQDEKVRRLAETLQR